MSLIIAVIGMVLFYTRRFRLGEIDEFGDHVRTAGAVLVAPAGGALVVGLILGLLTGGNIGGLRTALNVLTLLEFLGVLVAVSVAYFLIVRKEFLPGVKFQPRATPTNAAPAPPKPVMSTSEAAAYLRVSEARILQAIEEGRLPAARSAKGYTIARSVLDEVTL